MEAPIQMCTIMCPLFPPALKREASSELRRVEDKSRDPNGQEQVQFQEVQADEVVGPVVLGWSAKDHMWFSQR